MSRSVRRVPLRFALHPGFLNEQPGFFFFFFFLGAKREQSERNYGEPAKLLLCAFDHHQSVQVIDSVYVTVTISARAIIVAFV